MSNKGKNRLSIIIKTKQIRFLALISSIIGFYILSPSLVVFDRLYFYSQSSRVLFLIFLFVIYFYFIRKNKEKIISIIKLFSKKIFIYTNPGKLRISFFYKKLSTIKEFSVIFLLFLIDLIKSYKTYGKKNWHLFFNSQLPKEVSFYKSFTSTNLRILISKKDVFFEVIEGSGEGFKIIYFLSLVFRKKVFSYFFIESCFLLEENKNDDLQHSKLEYYLKKTNIKRFRLVFSITKSNQIMGFESYLKHCKYLKINPHLTIIPYACFSFFLSEVRVNSYNIIQNTNDTEKEKLVLFPFLLEHIQHAINKLRITPEIIYFQEREDFVFTKEKMKSIDYQNPLILKTPVSSFFYFSISFFILISVSFFINMKQTRGLESLLDEYVLALKTKNDSLSLLDVSYKIKKKGEGSAFSNFQLFYPFYLSKKTEKFIKINSDRYFFPFLNKLLSDSLKSNDAEPELPYSSLKVYEGLKSTGKISYPSLFCLIKAYFPNAPTQAFYYFSQHFNAEEGNKLERLSNKANYIKNELMNINQEALLVYEFHEDILNTHSATPSEDIENFGVLFDSTQKNSLPFLLTYKGYQKLLTQNIFQYEKNISRLFPDKTFSRIEHPKKLSLFWGFYDFEYIEAWQNYLKSISIKKFDNFDEVISAIKLLQKNKNPLQSLLKCLHDNTYPMLDERIKIYEAYKENHDFLGSHLKYSEQYKLIVRELKKIELYLEKTKPHSSQIKFEFQEAKALFSSESQDNPILNLIVQAEDFPEPIRSCLKQLANNILSVFFKGAMQQIQKTWSEQVYPYYQKDIHNNFLFIGQEKSNFELNNFDLFFEKEGYYQSFINNNLKPFINVDHLPWLVKSIFGQHLVIENSVLTSLSRFYYFSKLLFTQEEGQNIEFSIKPSYLDERIKSIRFSIGKTHFIYRHGPLILTYFKWPQEQKKITIDFFDFKNRNHTKDYEGNFSLFKLLSESHCKEWQEKSLFCDFSYKGYQFSYEIQFASTQLRDLLSFKNFELPEKLS